ncbi:MAG TPA: VCBS repeat-containing protein, partial [Planctomycetota bacterium]|nr:VCBS repeat-containing protein [Planctomycetota bacterium]
VDVCAVSGPTPQKIGILLGDGAGGFGAPASFGESNGGDRPTLADFNLDGDLDAITVVASQNPAGKLSVHYGNGAGGLLNPFYVSAPNLIDAALCDLNRDGVLDVVFAQYQPSGLLTARLGNATTGLGPPQSVATSAFPISVAVADFTGDGFPDAAYAAQGGLLGWSSNLGNGALGPTTEVATSPTGILTVALADLDHDARPDLLATSFGTLWVKLATGPATFGPPTAYPTNGESWGIAPADVDGDGNLDAVVGREAVALLLGDGAGAFAPAVSFAAGHGGGARSHAVADVDADGRPDVISIAFAYARVTVLRNQLLPAAGVASFGAGTPGCAGELGVGSNVAPTVGATSFAFTCTQAPPSAIGLGLVGDAASAAGVDPLGLGALFHVDLLASSFLAGVSFSSDAGGTAIAPAPIPANPALAGAALFAQAIWLEKPPFACGTSPFHLVSSSGLAMIVLP